MDLDQCWNVGWWQMTISSINCGHDCYHLRTSQPVSWAPSLITILLFNIPRGFKSNTIKFVKSCLANFRLGCKQHFSSIFVHAPRTYYFARKLCDYSTWCPVEWIKRSKYKLLCLMVNLDVWSIINSSLVRVAGVHWYRVYKYFPQKVSDWSIFQPNTQLHPATQTAAWWTHWTCWTQRHIGGCIYIMTTLETTQHKHLIQV